MIAFFKELETYQRPDFQQKFGSGADCKKIIDDLLELGFLKSDGKSLRFHFVGVFGIGSVVGCCFPKFFLDDNMDVNRFKKIVQIIRKCQHNRDNTYRYSYGDSAEFFNQLSVELYLIKDYIESGLYSNYKSFIEDNGDGEIDWEKTINETLAIIKNNRPYYTTLKTWATENDDVDYFRRLHKYVVTQCFKKMKDEGILDLFGIPYDVLSEESLKDFGGIEYITYQLNKEIQSQFVLRKQTLLKTLLSFFAKDQSCEANDSLMVYGVNNFDYIWQEACAYILNDKHKEYEEMIDNLRKPLWFHYYDDSTVVIAKNEENMLKTDIISVYEREGERTFCILDAKNYPIYWDENRYRNNPGVGDIVKQFAYHKEFLNFIAIEGYDHVVNALLFPKQEVFDPDGVDGNVDNFGYVEMPIMMDWGDEWLVPIHLVFLSPSFVLMSYLQNIKCSEQLHVIADFNKKRANQTKRILQETIGSGNGNVYCLLVQEKYVLENTQTQEKFFCFIKKKGDVEYRLHSCVDECTKLIAYLDSGECFVANIQPGDKIEIDFKELQNEFNRHCFMMQSGKLFKIKLNGWEKIEGVRRSDLNKFVTNDLENEFLPASSPRVINISL